MLLPTPWHRLQLAFVSVQRSEHSRQQPGQKTRYHMLTSSPGYIIISICPNWKLYLAKLKIVFVKINIVFEKFKLVCESDKPQKLCLKSTNWTVNSKFSWNRCAVWSEVTRWSEVRRLGGVRQLEKECRWSRWTLGSGKWAPVKIEATDFLWERRFGCLRL